MAGSKGIRAGKAFVEVGADDTKMQKALKRAANRLRAFGTSVSQVGQSMARVGAIAMAPLLLSSKLFASYGDSLGKMAKRTGISVESLSELQFVASQTGTEFEALETAFKRMQRTIYDAGRGLSTATDALADLGLNLRDLQGLSPEEQFKLLADRMGQITDDTRQAGIALSIFGRAGTSLIPMFEAGASGIAELQKRARDLGLTMSTEDAAAAEEFNDQLDALGKVVKRSTFEIGAALAPALEKVIIPLMDSIRGATQWIKEHQAVIVTALKVTAAVTGLGLALALLGKIATATAVILKGLSWVGAHPLVLVLGALAIIGVKVASSLGLFSSTAKDARHEVERLTQAIEGLTDADRRAGDELYELTLKASLSNEELKRAATIIADLGRRCDGFSGTIDGLNRRVEVSAESWETLSKAMAGVPIGGGRMGGWEDTMEYDLVRRVGILRLEQIEDEHARRIALLNEQYGHEMRLAQEAGKSRLSLMYIEKAKRLELAAIERDYQKRLADEQRAREEERRRELERQAQEYISEVERLAGTMNVGTFHPGALRSLGPPPAINERLLDASQQTAKNTKAMVRLLEGGGAVFAQ